MEEKYRIVWHAIGDPHFVDPPDKVLFESNDLDECRMFKKKYEEENDGWYELRIEKGQMKFVWNIVK